MSNFLKRLFTSIALVGLVGGMWLYTSPCITSLFLCIVACYTLLFEWPKFHYWWLTPLYPVMPFVLLIAFNSSPYRTELLWLLCIAIVHDSAAYVVGNLIGAHKLWPRVSPGKTWEGTIGGVVSSLIVSWMLLPSLVYEKSMLLRFTPLHYLVVALLVNIACVLGDLFESWLKRRAHLKDSGCILPGHGGVLDRLDSLFGAIVMWTGIHFFIKQF